MCQFLGYAQLIFMKQEILSMEVVNPLAAEVDIGSRSHWVAVGQSEPDVREYGVFNQDLFAMAHWMKKKELKPWQWRVLVLISKICMRF